ncbi:unnamed protein product [Closterium sp. NIES-53]
MDAEMAYWKSTGTYVDKVPPPGANIVDGMWIFRGVNFFQTFFPTPKMTALWVLLHVATQRDYELHSLDFLTAFLQGSLHEAIWRPASGRDTLRTTLATLGFAPSTVDPSLFLRTNTSLPPFYVLVYVDNLVFATTDTKALALVKAKLQERHTCTAAEQSWIADHPGQSTPHHHPHSDTHGAAGPSTLRLLLVLSTAHSSVYRPFALSSTSGRACRAQWSRACGLPHVPDDVHTTLPRIPSQPPGSLRGSRTSGMGLVLGGFGPVVLTSHSDASWADNHTTHRSTKGCEAKIYAGAVAAQELCWLTYLLIDLGERCRSPPQRGQLRLAYVATQANTADVFTKALGSSDNQRFSTALGLVPTLPHLLVS